MFTNSCYNWYLHLTLKLAPHFRIFNSQTSKFYSRIYSSENSDHCNFMSSLQKSYPKQKGNLSFLIRWSKVASHNSKVNLKQYHDHCQMGITTFLIICHKTFKYLCSIIDFKLRSDNGFTDHSSAPDNQGSLGGKATHQHPIFALKLAK